MKRPAFFLKDEQGQIFAGYLVALMMIFVVMASVMNIVRRDRVNTDRRVYQEQALEVAREGFEEGQSYFRRQAAGVYIGSGVEKATGQFWVTPWPIYPDAAFLPQSSDTDHFNLISFPANVCMTCAGPWAQKAGAGALIRTFPVFTVATSGTAEITTSPIWASYVLRRQNARNWSPGPNTFSAFTDPEAAHDLTSLRGQSPPGSGNYWSIVSRAYIFANQTGATTTAGFENLAMYQGNSILNAPLRTYNNKPLLLATAKVYGEIFRINCNDQDSAAWVNGGASAIANTKGNILGGSDGIGVVKTDGVAPTVNGGLISGTSNWTQITQAPTVANVFPGLTTTDLKKRADKVGGLEILPVWGDPNLSVEASVTSFIYLSATSGTFTFISATGAPVLSGVGLAFIDGNVTFQAGNCSTWSGIVYVNGNCTIHGPASITGTLMVSGTLTVGETGGVGDSSTGLVEYNSAAINTAKAYLQKFQVIKNSIVATTN
jgi:hypothetical protein